MEGDGSTAETGFHSDAAPAVLDGGAHHTGRVSELSHETWLMSHGDVNTYAFVELSEINLISQHHICFPCIVNDIYNQSFHVALRLKTFGGSSPYTG